MDQLNEPAKITFVEIKNQAGHGWVLVFQEFLRQWGGYPDRAVAHNILELRV